ncbi:CmlA/FloR family chloramphenicol efflux MFS transporter [Mesorhizobium sp. 1B3]|uniref:CmlA/FloR family chloramphenicol efflux MFS transporter n=1 Tax=Mesorhizobium sp. 1B3 TaxID=3243599 RepID=UPI003D97F921
MPHPQSFAWKLSLPAAILLMAPFDILASLAMDIYLPIVPAMPAILETSPSVVQLTLSLYMVLLGLGQIVFGPLSDRIGRRPVLLGGALIFGLASALLAVTTSAVVFVLLRITQAAGASAALVATFATVRDVYAERPEGAVIYSLFGSMLAFVPAFGPITGALIAETFGWRGIFVALAVLALMATLNATLKWRETRPADSAGETNFAAILRSSAFWTYTLGFSAAMGAFFVFFSTAPRVLIDRAGYSETAFSLVFGTAAIVMILTSRFAKRFVASWGIAGSLARGMAMLLLGAALLAVGQLVGDPSFATFMLPMWIIAVGIVFASSVTANGALQDFGKAAGAAVALYFCVQSILVATVGTALIVVLPGDTAWPLIVYCVALALLTLGALRLLQRRGKND